MFYCLSDFDLPLLVGSIEISASFHSLPQNNIIRSIIFHVQLSVMDLLLCFASLYASAQEEEADGKLTRNECTVSTWTTNNLFTLTPINSELVTWFEP